MNGSISERLRELQGEMSARKFAKELDLKVTTLWEYLRGREPPAAVIVTIARKLNLRVWWLLTGEGPKYGVGSEDGPYETSICRELREIRVRIDALQSWLDQCESRYECERR
jgi:hypothetical protein